MYIRLLNIKNLHANIWETQGTYTNVFGPSCCQDESIAKAFDEFIKKHEVEEKQKEKPIHVKE